MSSGRSTPALVPAWYRPPDATMLRWVALQAGDGWRAARARRLRGGMAMAVDAVVLRGPGGAVERLVLKRWLRPGWADEDPELTPGREASVLDALARSALPVPRVVGVDLDGRTTGVPALLMTQLDGRRPATAEEGRPARVHAMAAALAATHAVDGPVRRLVDPFRPWYALDATRLPPGSRHPDQWTAALTIAHTPPRGAEGVFLHRDFHPGNTLWQGAGLTGIVDWVSASLGPASADLAHWRCNLGTRHGIGVADRVLDGYRAATGAVPADQAWWDIRLLLDFIDEPDALGGEELGRFEDYLGALLRRV